MYDRWRRQAVENPNYEEIRDVLASAGLQVGVENKLYPRENSKELLYRGRIRVQLRQDSGRPVKPEFPSRKSAGRAGLRLYSCSAVNWSPFRGKALAVCMGRVLSPILV